MPIEHASVIDVITFDERAGQVTLGMIEGRAWSGSDLQLFQLQEKLNAYLSFALDGEMTEAYPQFLGKSVRLEIECAAPPDARTLEFLNVVREQIAFQDIKLEVRVTVDAARKSDCGYHCTCHSEPTESATSVDAHSSSHVSS
jgi:hypothetical protein